MKQEAPASESAQQLLTQLRSLLAEAEELVAGAEYPREELDNLHARLAQAQARLQEFYGTARQKIVDGAHTTDQAIRTHPYESVAVAVGLGILVGALLRRGH